MKKIFRHPFFRSTWVWALICLVLLALFDLMVMPFLTGGFKSTVEVPELKNNTVEEAQKILGESNLALMIDSAAEYSQDIEAGNIMKQRPVPLSRVKEGRRIWVTVSKGLKQLELPAFKGMSIRQSEITLQQLGMKLGEIKWRKNRNIPRGVVFDSQPKAGQIVESNVEVILFVSSGLSQQKGTTPKLVGLSHAKAKAVLSRWNLNEGKTSYREDTEKLPNTVLGQKPGPGFPLNENMSVDLIISAE